MNKRPTTPAQKLVAYSKSLEMVGTLKKQLTEEEAERILSKYEKKDILEVLLDMDNKPDLKKKYLSVGRTLQTWLNRKKSFESALSGFGKPKANNEGLFTYEEMMRWLERFATPAALHDNFTMVPQEGKKPLWRKKSNH